MNKDSKIFVAGHRGLAGSAISKRLREKGYGRLLQRTRAELDLRTEDKVAEFFKREKPDYVFLAAAKVGGIVANNTLRAEFLYENLMIQNNVIHHSYLNGVKKLLFLGSTCIYPRESPQPMKEDYLLTGPLEYTNEPYAIAKIAGIKLCESYNLQYGTNFISVMPTNLYGPNDSFDLVTSHVLPALVRKMHLAKALEGDDWDMIRDDLVTRPMNGITREATREEMLVTLNHHGVIRAKNGQAGVEIWGSGRPRREFLWSEDMADACVFVMERVDFEDTIPNGAEQIRNTHLNIGTGEDISIRDLAYLIRDIVGFRGELHFDEGKPDGTQKKLTDPSKLHDMGWRHTVELHEGVGRVYQWYCHSLDREKRPPIHGKL